LRFALQLAEMLGKTLKQLLSEITVFELRLWAAELKIRNG